MTNRILINATVADELRIAVVEDGELIDLDIEAAERGTIKGNIYKGVVHNVEGSLEAAFVSFGAAKQGFLPFSEIAPSQFYRDWDSKESPRITDVIKRGQDIVVQVAKDAVGEKGAALTTHLSLAGRYAVLMPGSDARGVSRKIEDEAERKRVRAIASEIELEPGMGYIVRTAGIGQSKEAIQADLNRLLELHKKLARSAEMARAPSVLYTEPDLIIRTLRDLVSDDIDEIYVDSRDEYESAREYFEQNMPEYVERLHLHQDPIPLFSFFRVEEQIEEAFQRKIPLPSGGSLVIDETEALVAIDVNSGKTTSERDHEDTVYLANFEAAQMIAKQLRLRDLGGIVVVDFIDMEERKNNKAVEQALLDATSTDRARIKISKILSNGLCIITRQRIRPGIKRSFQRRCTTCHGTGWLRTSESHALSILKRVETRLAQGEVHTVTVLTHRETAEHLLNTKRAQIMSLEREYQCTIVVHSRHDLDRDSDELVYRSRHEVLKEVTDRLPAREEPSRDRRRKKKRKKERGESKTEARETQRAVEAELDGDEKRKKRKKRGEKGEKRERGERGERAEKRTSDAPASAEPAPEAPRAPVAPTALEPVDGVTFTGRPSAEDLERIKAERAARRAARTKKPDAAGEGASGEGSAEPAPAAAPSTESEPT
jgi:ribonuclease E